MKRLLFIGLLCPFWLNGQSAQPVAQEQWRVNAMNELMRQNTSSLMLYYAPSESDIKGSRYFYDKYVEGEIWFINGDKASKDYLYKFDESQNSVQAIDKNGQEILVDWTKIYGCRMNIDGKWVVYFRSEVPGAPNKVKLFQLLYYTDNYQVIKLPSKRLIPKTKIFHNDDMQYMYLSEHQYFLKKGQGDFKEFNLKKKSILNAMPEKKGQLNKLFDTPQYQGRLDEGLFAQLLTELDKKTQ